MKGTAVHFDCAVGQRCNRDSNSGLEAQLLFPDEFLFLSMSDFVDIMNSFFPSGFWLQTKNTDSIALES